MTEPLVQDMKNVTVRPGETAKLACLAAGDAIPHIRFFREINDTKGEVVDMNEYKNRTKMETISPNNKIEFYKHYLWIYNVTLADEGKYTCVAGNSIGNTTKDVYLIVDTTEKSSESRVKYFIALKAKNLIHFVPSFALSFGGIQSAFHSLVWPY